MQTLKIDMDFQDKTEIPYFLNKINEQIEQGYVAGQYWSLVETSEASND